MCTLHFFFGNTRTKIRMKKKDAHNTEKSQKNSNCSTKCNIKLIKCTLSLKNIKRNEKKNKTWCYFQN